jgi:hypothetical protein
MGFKIINPYAKFVKAQENVKFTFRQICPVSQNSKVKSKNP